jgi:hypothetical protein
MNDLLFIYDQSPSADNNILASYSIQKQNYLTSELILVSALRKHQIEKMHLSLL